MEKLHWKIAFPFEMRLKGHLENEARLYRL